MLVCFCGYSYPTLHCNISILRLSMLFCTKIQVFSCIYSTILCTAAMQYFFMPRSFELLFSKAGTGLLLYQKRVPTSADTLNISIVVSVLYDISYLCKILLIQYFFHSSNIHSSHYTKYNA